MDIEKLIEAVRLCGSTPKVYQCKQCAYWSGGDMSKCIPRMTTAAATALSTLQAENEKLRAEVESLKKGHCAGCSIPAVKTEQIRDLTDAPKLRTELEQVKAERDTALNDLNTLRLQSGWQCFACDNADATEGDSRCNGCNYIDGHNYKWRGPKED